MAKAKLHELIAVEGDLEAGRPTFGDFKMATDARKSRTYRFARRNAERAKHHLRYWAHDRLPDRPYRLDKLTAKAVENNLDRHLKGRWYSGKSI